MYVSAWPGFRPGALVRSRRSATRRPFPFDAPGATLFYRARNAIYHLFRALPLRTGAPVLVPDYHSGNEVAAIRAAGRTVRFYHIGRDLRPDLTDLERQCRRGAGALLTIHYLGFPQPVEALVRICRRHEVPLIEDCALALFSALDRRPLGTFGSHAVFCLYKTLPLPHGGLAVANHAPLGALDGVPMRPCGALSVAARLAELSLERLRAACDPLGRTLFAMKRATGRALTACGLDRVPVGDMGFDLDAVDVAPSGLCRRLIARLDDERIREIRRANYLHLARRLAGSITPLVDRLDDGVCPLFFPLLVDDKHAVATALWRRGIQAVEFWNGGDPEASGRGFEDARFLRAHVLELPIHQDVRPAQLDYMADQILALPLRPLDHRATVSVARS
jgi:dTDP-4-amino-4,6-dideoxygalactose transaminase